MEFLITNRFKKKYLEKNEKYFTLEDFLENIAEKEHTFITLHIPFSKFKNKINKVAIRWVLFYYLEDKIVPIIVSLKKDKNFWENISRKINRTFILEEFDFSMDDIESWDFEIFEV